MSTDGRSANGWLAQGTHYASHMENGELHIISDGHGDNRPNRVEIDVTAMQANQTYEVSFDARWVSGASRLIVETWDHSIATSISLPVPANIGTPGARNSCFIAEPAPQVDGLMHDPAVPAPRQNVRVTARVVSPDAFAAGPAVSSPGQQHRQWRLGQQADGRRRRIGRRRTGRRRHLHRDN